MISALSLMIIARRYRVKGRVQGVGFRYFALQAARRLGLVGIVKNMPDGTVEAVAEGAPAALDQFRSELERGPDYSHVTAVDEVEMPPSGRYKNFDVSF
ncbi:MAG TPA: acylphosphatase [Blastocatellia bacterium]|nr:acylphosphatase [Blastocatellia bacterium]